MKSKILLLLVVLTLALGIRVWNFPACDQVRDGDEIGYAMDGLFLLEGVTPSFKFVPAGPLIWMSWSYGAVLSAKYFFWPAVEDHKVQSFLRPFVALDCALFETFRDMSSLRLILVGVIVLLSIGATWAGFEVGYYRAGLPGALLVAGLMAVIPLFVTFSGMARPYAVAWSFGVVAQYFATTQSGRKRLLGAAIAMGLSISSRIEMVSILPIILWEFWHRKELSGFIRSVLKFLSFSSLTILLVSPWLFTNLIGNLRSVVMIRFFPVYSSTWFETFTAFMWSEGLGPLILLTAIGLALSPRPSRFQHWLLGGLLGLLLLSIFISSQGGLRHQGTVVVALVIVAPLALKCVQDRWPQFAFAFTVAALLLPMAQTISFVSADRLSYFPDKSTEWVERHVPSGTVIYTGGGLRVPLPTVKSADALWTRVTDSMSWRTKFTTSLNRFHIPSETIPRALSEDNMIPDRNRYRRWFILGGRSHLRAPRYNIVLYGAPLFDLTSHEAISKFKNSGGVLIWKGVSLRDLGAPAVSWTNQKGEGVFIYTASVSCAPRVDR